MLAMSTHHQEYGQSTGFGRFNLITGIGFPSSHSTNSVSIALYAGEWLWGDLGDSEGLGEIPC